MAILHLLAFTGYIYMLHIYDVCVYIERSRQKIPIPAASPMQTISASIVHNNSTTAVSCTRPQRNRRVCVSAKLTFEL